MKNIRVEVHITAIVHIGEDVIEGQPAPDRPPECVEVVQMIRVENLGSHVQARAARKGALNQGRYCIATKWWRDNYPHFYADRRPSPRLLQTHIAPQIRPKAKFSLAIHARIKSQSARRGNPKLAPTTK